MLSAAITAYRRFAHFVDNTIKSWTISNFKSFYKVKNLTIAPLTLLCGANSAGKSSILQSMLLIKQTIEHSPTERVVALNGPLVQLGTFSDILNDRAAVSDGREIGLGWKISHNVEDEQSNSNIYIDDYEVEYSSLGFSFDTVGPIGERSTLELQPDLKASHMSARLTDREGGVHDLNVQIERVTGRGRRIQFDSSTLVDDAKLRFRVVEIDDATRDSAGPTLVQSKLVGANINHFAPNALIVRYDRNRRLAKQIAMTLAGTGGPRRFRLPPIKISESVLNVMKKALAPLTDHSKFGEMVSGLLDPRGDELTVEGLSQRFRVTPPPVLRQVREALSHTERNIEHLVYEDLGADQTISVSRVDEVSRVTSLNDAYFRFRMRYIGPLRADPRPLYPLQALSSPTDVGPKGEQTAAVLHLNAKRKVGTVSSSAFKGTPTDANPITDMTLTEAVADWLEYLGVAEAFETVEKGKLGHELRVRTPGMAEFQDLTNVGVGVSQVLPIVVTCLLASPGSTIILEQPELHLHPAVQARLADFFVAMILLNKQCIIETHSEHLIERIRFRVVQDRTNTVHESTKIYFFYKSDGSTAVKDVAVTRYGAIDDWPADFFDQSQIANEQIVLTALQRRRDETRREND
ncbi:MAG: DUF3696 domain-containing protein [Mesorhizobium sp.]|uniref:AAA family ATPase n=1 Tax=Mesorhizobium sp. TaxID=1871066 RepID=UPI000FE84CEB|nr:DUF3696 domain-containing protein [Mesorhizobium sp.]RWI50106.1 MAG: DUF3696 domain-containing protein [Mesorhizobium sp.]